MRNLCDIIEAHIKGLLEGAGAGPILIRRNTLAEKIGCAPSQINYVLETRFNIERGYFVESRRGGGGYVRIERRRLGPDRDIITVVFSKLPETVSRAKAEDYVTLLEEEGLVTAREASMLRQALGEGISRVDPEYRDVIRATLLRCMLLGLAKAQASGV
ncbi:MAG: CtsR family transcriptional regulator [Firmicutes bacterium]|nr:CtsR family transcriptional regulator [Bacillota bacterium]